MVNINNCTVDALTAKVGIPLGVAWQIVAYKHDRKQRHAIECLDELKNIPGMAHQVITALQDIRLFGLIIQDKFSAKRNQERE